MQVSLIKPKIIVCLGRVAACRIIDEGYKVTKQHGEFIEKGGVLMMGTFHPAALLRNPGLKPAAFADLIGLRDKIEKVCEKNKAGLLVPAFFHRQYSPEHRNQAFAHHLVGVQRAEKPPPVLHFALNQAKIRVYPVLPAVFF